MKRLITLMAALVCMTAYAQTSTVDYKSNYERQVRGVGYAGVGVETIINRWETAEPDNAEVHNARFNYHYVKSQGTEVVSKESRKYLGMEPVLTLKDSLGKDVFYFQVLKFDDEIFGEAVRSIDKAISLDALEMRYRISKISAMLNYEKESPDMAASEILSLIDHYLSTKQQAWKIDGEAMEEDVFVQAISEYCYSLFQTATPASYNYFHQISIRMNKLYPKETVFINNQGAYWQAAEKNYKKALKFYKKALKIDPEDFVALRNTKTIQTLQSKR